MYIFLGLYNLWVARLVERWKLPQKKSWGIWRWRRHAESKCNRCSTIDAYYHNADSKHPVHLNLKFRVNCIISTRGWLPLFKIPPDIQLTHSQTLRLMRTQIIWSSIVPYPIPYRTMHAETKGCIYDKWMVPYTIPCRCIQDKLNVSRTDNGQV